MRKAMLGNIGITALALANIVLWFIFLPLEPDTPQGQNRQLTAEIISSTAMILMACALFLSTRPRFLEPIFGGLDKMYHAHKNAALAALLMIVAHFLVMPLGAGDIITETGEEISVVPVTFLTTFLAGLSVPPGVLLVLGETLGLLAFAGLLLLVLLTVAPRLPLVGRFTRFSYSRWVKTHKFIGLFFIMGFVHAITLESRVLTEPVLFAYLTLAAAVGTGSYLYTELLAGLFKRRFRFLVQAVHRLNGTTLEVVLQPQGRRPPFTAGQFAFVSFPGERGLKEPHPFTVSSSPGEDQVRFTIKASGDWTRHLNANLEAGALARVDGCYGRFNYKTSGPEQVWVAGGIGVTPFLSWVRDFGDGPDADVDMFYSVRSSDDLLFHDELTDADRIHDQFRYHPSISSVDGNLSVEQIAELCRGEIADKHVYLCGPPGMMAAMERGFKRLGVPGRNIHFEEFNFR